MEYSKKVRGFTLIELTVVIAILGLVYALVIPRFSNITGLELKSTARKVASLVRYAYDDAVSENKRLRMVFGFGDEYDSIWIEEWVESSPTDLLDTKKEDYDSEDKKTLLEKEAEEKNPLGKYVPLEGKYSKMKLPEYIKIKGIYLASQDKTIDRNFNMTQREKERKTELPPPSIPFLPQGFTEDSIIYLSDGKNRDFSIRINPVTGKPTIYDSYVDPKNL